MASTSRKGVPTTKSILTSVMTLEGHEANIRSISYLPDGQRIISGSVDETVRQWDLKAAREIEEVQDVCGKNIWALAVSRDGRWVVTAGGYVDHPGYITCIDISADSRLLATGSWDETARIWNLETGKLVAGPFKSVNWMGAVRFSTDSKKLAINSYEGMSLEVWDVQKQKLDVRIGKHNRLGVTQHAPMLWTNNNLILAAFTFTDDYASTIYEFNASTLETVGIPFEGHTDELTGLALSSDSTLLASSSDDETIKFWAFESRQLLASFDIRNPITLVFSPDSRQFAYTTDIENDYKIYICNTPLDVLAQADIPSQTSALKKSTLGDLLHSDATSRPPPGRRRPPISAIPMVQRSPPTVDPQQPISLRLRQFLSFSPRTNAVRRVQPRNPLDVPATLPLPSSPSGQAVTRVDRFEISSPPHPSNGPVTQFLRQHLSFLVPSHSHGPPVVEVAPGRKFNRLVAANLPEYKKVDDTRRPSSQQPAVQQDVESSDVDSLPDVHWCKAFLCYYSCWSHGRLRMPPRWRLERVERPRQDGTTNASGSGSGTHPRS